MPKWKSWLKTVAAGDRRMRIRRLPILTTLIAAAFSTAASNPVVADQPQAHLECEDDYGKSFLSLDIDYAKSTVTERHEAAGSKYVNTFSANITDASIEWKVPPPPWHITWVLNRYSGQLTITNMDSSLSEPSRYKCRVSEQKF
jgi:hypothetical protein